MPLQIRRNNAPSYLEQCSEWHVTGLRLSDNDTWFNLVTTKYLPFGDENPSKPPSALCRTGTCTISIKREDMTSLPRHQYNSCLIYMRYVRTRERIGNNIWQKQVLIPHKATEEPNQTTLRKTRLRHESKWFIAFATCCDWRLFAKIWIARLWSPKDWNHHSWRTARGCR